MYAKSQAYGAPDHDGDADLAAVADRFRALADPARLRLLDLLRGGERGAGELARACGASAANVSRHLAVLRRHGLVASHRHGREVAYRLADDCVPALCDRVCDVLARRADRARRAGETLWTHAEGPGSR